MYHSISNPPGTGESDIRYSCPPELFEEHLEYLRTSDWQVASLGDVEQYLHSGTGLVRNSVIITFDDGYRDNHDYALPKLRKHGVPATVFVATGFIADGKGNSESMRYRDREMLSWSQLQEMQDYGISIGAHTVTHPSLIEVSDSRAEDEIAASKRRLEDKLCQEVKYFAYPYGLYNVATRKIVKDVGFTLACSTRSGFNGKEADPYALRRIEVYGTDPVWKLAQKLTFGVTDASALFPLRYYVQRLKSRLSRQGLD